MYKNKLNQIKQLLNIDVKLEEMTLENGVKIMAESWEVGFPVFAIAEDGSQVALPEGPYVLEDGTKFVVDAEGIITSFGETETPEDEKVDASKETSPAQAKKMIESIVKETQFSEDKKIETKDEPKDEIKVNFSDEQKTELSAMITEGIKSYFDELIAETKKAKTEEKKVEMSEQKSDVKPIKHSPEKVETKKQTFQYATKRRESTKDRVFNKLFK